MKTICIFLAAAALGGCGGPPPDDFVKAHFRKAVLSRYAGRADVTAFKKLKSVDGVFFGVKSYDVEYNYRLACNSDIQIPELEMLSADDLRRLDDFLAKQTGDWEKINFAPFSNLQINGEARSALYKAYTGKKSLLYCRIGDNKDEVGRTRFLLRDEGWDADRIFFPLKAQ